MRCERPFFVRKDSNMRTIADLKGKRVDFGYSAMRNIDVATRAMLATAGLTEADIKVVLVPNVIRSADDFVSGNAAMFYLRLRGPQGARGRCHRGRSACIDMTKKACSRPARSCAGDSPEVARADLVGVEKPMKVYSFDNVFFTSAKGRTN